ncbi:hypothetical protein CC99x_011405 [Candidatus Berkiella cookevillensis]|uniref:Uncharacterized protein n=1 Tax=Candidatus Berkiella cookevillensis TaxID=437022 RepID=A0A0Q9YF15_9GAMM|nr:hypothetical protein [Candidatus Berkiella cookevillensis]MCS5709501.1 hypothetical protein [Candidatus Berkiella cookevillensis]
MLNFNVPFLWRVVSTSVASMKSLVNVCLHSKRKIELERLAYLNDTNQIIADPAIDITADIAQNESDLTKNLAQTLLFGFATYRALNGQEDLSDCLIVSAATAYGLYEPTKKVVNQIVESETVQMLGNKVFRRC